MALFDELKGLGFVEGQNLKIVVNGFGLRDEQFAEAPATLAKSAPDVIFCVGNPAMRAAGLCDAVSRWHARAMRNPPARLARAF